jgi:hypothetical protein
MSETDPVHELGLSFDNTAFKPRATIGRDLVERMETDANGPKTFLEAVRHKHEPTHDDFYTRFRTMRDVFDAGYGADKQIGEAFEDGAIIGLTVADDHQERLLESILEKMDKTNENFEVLYYRKSDATFSDQRMNFIRAVRRESSSEYVRFADAFKPVVSYVNIRKYEETATMMAIADGIGYVMGHLAWAYGDDFRAFELDFKRAESDYSRISDLRNKLGEEVMAIIERGKS